MLGLYTNLNSSYVNQNYSNQAYSSQNYNPYQQTSLFGGYSNPNGYQQENSSNINLMLLSVLSSLLPILLSLFANRQPAAQPPVTNNSGQNNIYNTIINIILNSAPAVKEEPEDVFIVGGYQNCSYNLGDTIGDFSNDGTGEATWHSKDDQNDAMLKELLTKMSAENKGLKFEKGYAYVISKDGEIIDKISATQIVDKETLTGGGGQSEAEINNTFEILQDLGVNKTARWNSIEEKNSEENVGGQIKLNGKTYDVLTTAIRKDTPLTFDLNGDGVKTSEKVIDYDIDGDGDLDKINDVADGTLSIRGGKDGKDLFGNNTDLDGDGKADGFANGFEALKALAQKEGLINGKDDMVLDSKDLKILKEKYQLGMKTDGDNSKEKSFEELGITEINLGASDEVTETVDFDGRNNDVLTQEGATFKINGKDREYADVLHEIK